MKALRRPDTEILPADFEAQMKMLKDRQIPVIPLQDFLAWRRGEKNIPSRCALITLDDGWKSQYDVAWPILKKYGFPFTMFIYTDYVKPGPRSGGESMTWEQLGEMRDAGVDIESHTISHPYLTAKKGKTEADYEQWLWHEINDSKKMLEAQLGIKVNAFAIPYGKFNPKVQELANKAGYEAIFTVYGQVITFGSKMDSLGRYMIEGNKPQVFTAALSAFGSSGSSDAPIQLASSSMMTQPMQDETISNPMPSIKANLATLGEIDEGSVKMRLSGIGEVPAHYDAQTKLLSYQLTEKLRDASCTVVIAAKQQGKTLSTRWTFNYDPNAASAPKPAETPLPPRLP